MQPIENAVNSFLDEPTKAFYLRSLDLLDRSGIPYLVGGAYALAHWAGIVRHTKDLDIFVRPADAPAALELLDRAGYRTELTFPHWLGKGFDPADETTFVDVIFSSGNGLCTVDEQWFTHAADAQALGRPARLCPAEEMIWQKSFIQERERFDGADVCHMLLSRGRELDYGRLLSRFAGHEAVFLSHVLMFRYIYPGARENVPQAVVDELYRRSQAPPDRADHLCRGPFVSREQYLPDVGQRGLNDARLGRNGGPLQEPDVQRWTDAIGTIR